MKHLRDRAVAAGRLRRVVHDRPCHLSRPADPDAAEGDLHEWTVGETR